MIVTTGVVLRRTAGFTPITYSSPYEYQATGSGPWTQSEVQSLVQAVQAYTGGTFQVVLVASDSGTTFTSNVDNSRRLQLNSGLTPLDTIYDYAPDFVKSTVESITPATAFYDENQAAKAAEAQIAAYKADARKQSERRDYASSVSKIPPSKRPDPSPYAFKDWKEAARARVAEEKRQREAEATAGPAVV